jgi:hypothetical protein
VFVFVFVFFFFFLLFFFRFVQNVLDLNSICLGLPSSVWSYRKGRARYFSMEDMTNSDEFEGFDESGRMLLSSMGGGWNFICCCCVFL